MLQYVPVRINNVAGAAMILTLLAALQRPLQGV